MVIVRYLDMENCPSKKNRTTSPEASISTSMTLHQHNSVVTVSQICARPSSQAPTTKWSNKVKSQERCYLNAPFCTAYPEQKHPLNSLYSKSPVSVISFSSFSCLHFLSPCFSPSSNKSAHKWWSSVKSRAILADALLSRWS